MNLEDITQMTKLEERAEKAGAEVERLKVSIANHFATEHLAGDGPEIDRWKAKVKELEELFGKETFAERAALRHYKRAEKLVVELAKWMQAVGLASTTVPEMEIDGDHPLEMMQKVVAEVGRLRKIEGIAESFVGTWNEFEKPMPLEWDMPDPMRTIHEWASEWKRCAEDAAAELAEVDSILARRTALDDLLARCEKISRTISVASSADKAEARAKELKEGLRECCRMFEWCDTRYGQLLKEK